MGSGVCVPAALALSVNMRTCASSSAIRRELSAAQTVPQFGHTTLVAGTSLSIGAASIVAGVIGVLEKRKRP